MLLNLIKKCFKKKKQKETSRISEKKQNYES
jgi:hypothetical protein